MEQFKQREHGLLLVIIVGLLTLMMVMAVFFVTLTRQERTRAGHGVEGLRAKLLARSGLEYSLARLLEDSDPAPSSSPEEDWRFRGDPSAPLETVLNPSFDHGEPYEDRFPEEGGNGRYDTGQDPYEDRNGNGKRDAWSGRLRGTYGFYADRFKLRVDDANGRIFINGGALDAQDRNGNGIPDHRDPQTMRPHDRDGNGRLDPGEYTPDGPNGWLVRLLNNLERQWTGTESPALGERMISARPFGGYSGLSQVEHVASSIGIGDASRFLALRAWTDPNVIFPQPADERPWRWRDIDPAYRRVGTRRVAHRSSQEGEHSYVISWKRDFIYAWRQLRLAPVTLEPRAPVTLSRAPARVLAAVWSGLKGVYLHVWEGNLGYDDGFGFMGSNRYEYPGKETSDSPWIRTRAEYGQVLDEAFQEWYGGNPYRPRRDGSAPPLGMAGSLPWPAPLGELKETPPITLGQGMQAALRMRAGETVTSWPRMQGFLQSLPVWEDADGDGLLDGGTYETNHGDRRRFEWEDQNDNGILDREFLDVDRMIPGLTIQQKDLLLSMADPNSRLNDFNPDAMLWRWVDKSDILDHTTEFLLERSGVYQVDSAGLLLSPRRGTAGETRGVHRVSAGIRLFDLYRDTTQRQFMREHLEDPGKPIPLIFSGDPPPYPMAGNRLLHSVPELSDDALYDGGIRLGAAAPLPGPPLETLRGTLYGTADAESGDIHVPDRRGPSTARLIPDDPDVVPGHLFTDGVYVEKDVSLKYPIEGVLREPEPSSSQHPFDETFYIYLSFWWKPNWFPQAAPRPHGLFSFSRENDQTGNWNAFGASRNVTPLDGLRHLPVGLYFVPGRNNRRETVTYSHPSQLGEGWPPRSLLWGTTHSLFRTEALNRFGWEDDTSPLLKGREWVHVGAYALVGAGTWQDREQRGNAVWITGRTMEGGGWNHTWHEPLKRMDHTDGSPNHVRFGEITTLPNMNYAADITVGPVVMGHSFDPTRAGYLGMGAGGGLPDPRQTLRDQWVDLYSGYFRETARFGRYYKEPEAVFRGPAMDADIGRLRSVHWTAWEPELDPDHDGVSDSDRFNGQGEPTPNGKNDVHVRVELWWDPGTPVDADDLRIARFEDQGGENRVSPLPELDQYPFSRFYYRVFFVNEWDVQTRLNTPLNVSPFFEDITIAYVPRDGPSLLFLSEN